ncbi:MAG: hypothetical protein P4L57_13585 [Rhizomicrobium sp.]|nr:hypothetical protein [Rhizomicrobium sp.]
MLDALEVVVNLVSGLGDVATIFLGRDDDIRPREALVVFAVIAVMLVAGIVLSSWIVAGVGITLPWMIGERLVHARRRYGGLDAAYERHQRQFYRAAAMTLVALMALQLAAALLPLSLLATLWAHIPDTALAHSLVAASFPVALLGFWYARNPVQALGGGVLAAGLISQACDQLFRSGTPAFGHDPLSLWLMTAGAVLVLLGFAGRKSATNLPVSSGPDLRRP